MRERTKDRAERAIAWSAAVVVHVALVGALARLPLPVDAARVDTTIDVEFIRRSRPARVAVSEPLAVHTVRNAGASRHAKPAAGQVANEAAHASDASTREEPTAAGVADHHATRPLDLRVPAAEFALPRARGLQRAPSLESRSTRFSRAWVPEGNAAEQASFRSPAVRAALGLFGGPPRRCSEVERRLRRIDCLPLHGQEAEDEMLLRAVDERVAD